MVPLCRHRSAAGSECRRDRAGFRNRFCYGVAAGGLIEGAKAIIAAWRGPGTLQGVTHAANIQALTGANPASGEIVVIKAVPDGIVRKIGRIAVPES
jgi:hypothetical protein